MKIPTRHGMAGTRVTAMLGVAALACAAALAITGPADAATVPHDFSGAPAVVPVQTDNTAGNQVVVYDRASDGTLSQAGAYQPAGSAGRQPDPRLIICPRRARRATTGGTAWWLP